MCIGSSLSIHALSVMLSSAADQPITHLVYTLFIVGKFEINAYSHDIVK
jgi:hypothetical protein